MEEGLDGKESLPVRRRGICSLPSSISRGSSSNVRSEDLDFLSSSAIRYGFPIL